MHEKHNQYYSDHILSSHHHNKWNLTFDTVVINTKLIAISVEFMRT